jgi:hypothetical protein
MAAALADRPIALRGGLVAHAYEIHGSDGGLVLLFVHHILSDGVSTDILFRQFVALYESEVSDRGQHAISLRRTSMRGLIELDQAPLAPATAEHWRAQLPVRARARGLPEPEDWWSRRKPIIHEGPVEFSADTMTALRLVARRERIQFFGVILAAAAEAAPLREEDHIVFAVVRANRDDPRVADAVGNAVDFLPVRVDLSGRPSFVELAHRASDAWRQSLRHLAPFGAINQALGGNTEWPATTTYHLSINYIPRGPGTPAGRISRLIVPQPLRRVMVSRWACGSFPFEFGLVESEDGAVWARAVRVGDVMDQDRALATLSALREVLTDAAATGPDTRTVSSRSSTS